MLYDTIKPYLRPLTAALLLLVIGLAMLNLYDKNSFRVVSTDPTVKDLTTWSPTFTVAFNKDLSQQHLSVSTSPKIIYNNQVRVTGMTLSVSLSVPLNAQQTYTITINDITDTAGQTLKNKRFSFKPTTISKNQLSDDDQETLINRNTSSKVYQDPILAHLPYLSLDFNLTSSFPVGRNNAPTLVLTAQLLLNAAEASNQPVAIAERKQEVQQYIQSLGLNPSNYTILYSVQTP